MHADTIARPVRSVRRRLRRFPERTANSSPPVCPSMSTPQDRHPHSTHNSRGSLTSYGPDSLTGTDFKTADELFSNQFREEAVVDETPRQAANANPLRTSAACLTKLSKAYFIDRLKQNEELLARYMNDAGFPKLVGEHQLFRSTRKSSKPIRHPPVSK